MIVATIDIARAGNAVWDVIVIGAGPAGALAAQQCARRGLATLLVEKATFPRYKVCGCCVNGRARAALAQAGLGSLVEDEGAVHLHAFHVASRGRVAKVALPEGYVSLSRARLDAAVVREAIAAGAQFLPGVKATIGEVVGETREVKLHAATRAKAVRVQGDTTAALESPTPKAISALRVPPIVVAREEAPGGTLKRATCLGVESEHEHEYDQEITVHAKIVLAASGLGGDVAEGSRVGIGIVIDASHDNYAPGVTYMACGQRGYLGLQRIEDGRLDVAAAVDAAWMRSAGGARHAAEHLLDEAGLPDLNFDDVSWKGTAPLTRRPSRVTMRRVFALGDAAGYVEPFTGEGIAWALSAAVAVAPVAARAVAQYDETHERVWQECHRDLVTRRQWICKAMAAGLRRPSLVSIGVRAVAAMPLLARPLVWEINRAPSNAAASPYSA